MIEIQAGLSSVDTINLVKLTLEGTQTAYEFFDGETITQSNIGGTATGIVVARYLNILTLSNVSGYFVIGTNIAGGTSGASFDVTKYDNTITATATGIVHEVKTNSVALTGVNGTFLLSDTETNTINTFKGQTSQAIAQIDDISTSSAQLIDGTGQFMYVENFVPIARDPDQTERIKLVIEF